MKETKLLAVTAILLLTSCSPKVVTHIVRTYPNPVPADSVYVIEPGDTVPNTAETLGSVSVVDRGTSRKCCVWHKKPPEKTVETGSPLPNM